MSEGGLDSFNCKDINHVPKVNVEGFEQRNLYNLLPLLVILSISLVSIINNRAVDCVGNSSESKTMSSYCRQTTTARITYHHEA